MKFINRKQELDFLERKHSSKQAELIIIYGRRRIGKTELITKFAARKKHLYFMGRLESREDTIKRINQAIIETLQDTSLLKSPLTNWDAVFEYFGKLHERFAIIFDEFPFLVDRFPEIVSVLQDKWDSQLKNTQLMIILSGSTISMMEKYALEYKSPLYGRRTGQWNVEKLNINHLTEFFPDYSVEDIIRVNSCIDTIPGYLSLFDPKLGVEENLKQKVFSKGEFLYEEVEILLREELRDPSNYMSILSAIAGGMTAFNEINNKTKLDKSILSKYIHTLEVLRIVKKIFPINLSDKAKLKSSLYTINDNFIDFWLKFVYLNKDEIERNKYKITNLEQFISYKFEAFCRDLLRQKYNNVGSFWHKSIEIDIAAQDEKGILLGECKWKENVDAADIFGQLKDKAKHILSEERKITYCIFAKSFKKKIKEKNLLLYDLKDIEKEMKHFSTD